MRRCGRTTGTVSQVGPGHAWGPRALWPGAAPPAAPVTAQRPEGLHAWRSPESQGETGLVFLSVVQVPDLVTLFWEAVVVFACLALEAFPGRFEGSLIQIVSVPKGNDFDVK